MLKKNRKKVLAQLKNHNQSFISALFNKFTTATSLPKAEKHLFVYDKLTIIILMYLNIYGMLKRKIYN